MIGRYVSAHLQCFPVDKEAFAAVFAGYLTPHLTAIHVTDVPPDLPATTK